MFRRGDEDPSCEFRRVGLIVYSCIYKKNIFCSVKCAQTSEKRVGFCRCSDVEVF